MPYGLCLRLRTPDGYSTLLNNPHGPSQQDIHHRLVEVYDSTDQIIMKPTNGRWMPCIASTFLCPPSPHTWSCFTTLSRGGALRYDLLALIDNLLDNLLDHGILLVLSHVIPSRGPVLRQVLGAPILL